jgi:hypothetical protein
MPIFLLTVWAPVFTGFCRPTELFVAGLEHDEATEIGRFGAAAFAVLVLHTGALGMMIGVLAGSVIALV